MAPIQSAIAKVGIAKQSAKGSAAASPTFGHGVLSGAVLNVEVSQELGEATSGKRVSPSVDRTSVIPGMDFTARAHPKSVGLWLYGAMGAISTSGSSTYTHVCTVADDLPYLTGFGLFGSNYTRVNDLKVDSLSFKWDAAGPVEMSVAALGTVIGFPVSFPVVNDESLADYFRASSGTFKLDVDSATPATASITGGEVTISNNLEAYLLSGSISPDDVFPGRQEVECSFDLVVADIAAWRTIVTGTDSGSTASAAAVMGSFEIVFTNGTNSLKLEAANVAFVCDFPEAAPAGGPAKITLAGMVVQTAAGLAFTGTVVNAQSTY